jgi:hypothetical protein
MMAKAGTRHPNLVGWWRMENNANDASGAGKNAAWTGTPAYASGKSGRAIDLPGSASVYVAPPDDVGLTTTNGTIAAWIKNDTISTDAATRDYSIGGRTTDGDRLYLLAHHSDLNYWIGLGGLIDTGVMQIGTDTWYHVALTWINGDYVWYLNGVGRKSGTYSGFNVVPALCFGGLFTNGSPGDSRFFMDGQMDEVMIFNAALDANDIKRVMMGLMPIRRY